MTPSLTPAELQRLGLRVTDGKAVKIASTEASSEPAARSGFRSKWESEFSVMLDAQKMAKAIRDWRYEGVRLKLATGAWYKADFLVWHNDGALELCEVKGFFRESSKVRWKVAVDRYPMFRFALWTKRDGVWDRIEYHGASL